MKFKNEPTIISGISVSDKGFIKDHVRRHFICAVLPVMVRYPAFRKKVFVEAGGGVGLLAHEETK